MEIAEKTDKQVYIASLEWAQEQDRQDPLKDFRNRFHIPRHEGKDIIYLTGNSLGLQPKSVRSYIEQELLDWELHGVEAHFNGENPWFSYHKLFEGPLSRIVGAMPSEVVAMNVLTVNLHLMFTSFYRPEGNRRKIIVERGAFPSDYYAVESQIRLHGFDPDECMLELTPREGEDLLRTEDILNVIQVNRDELALVLLGGVNYYSGQFFDIAAITAAAHGAGALAGYDLAHAAGNVPLKLHDWGVDFAAWCSYKYLNSGPGGVGGCFVHDRWADKPELPRLAGWWGHEEGSRFEMKKGFKPAYGAQGWQLSNAQILPMAVHRASLELFELAGMENLRAKSLRLTGFMEYLIKERMSTRPDCKFRIITPTDPNQRGAQLSILALEEGKELFARIIANNIIADWREPNVIRVAPAPLYNTFEEVYRFVEVLFG